LRTRLDLHASDLLLVTEQEGAGLRQTFFHQGELRVSRLSPAMAAGASPGVRAAYVQEEVERTRRYLQSVQLLAYDARLTVTVIASEAWLGDLHANSRPGAQWHLVDPSDLQRRTGIALPPTGYANSLFAHLFASEGGNHYAQASHLRQRDLHRLRSAVEVSGVIAGVAAMLLATDNLLDTVELRRATAALVAAEAQQQTPALIEHAADLPAALAADQLRDAVESAERLAAVNMQPRLALSRVGGVLKDYPEFTLRRLHWGASARADFSDHAATFRPSAALTGAAPGLYHGVELEGQVIPFSGDYREALNRFSGLLVALRQMPDVVDVNVFTVPLELHARFTGSVGSEVKETPEARFALRVVFKL
jgi:hypothetical protein